MSIFDVLEMTCAHCGAKAATEVVVSVNADRRPDLRKAILDGTFQAIDCPGCGERLRLEPDFIYFELGRRQWIVARPADTLEHWQSAETEAHASFVDTFGPGASPAARKLGEGLTPRLVFGWPALREKLLCAESGLRDEVLEMLKASILAAVEGLELDAHTEIRLAAVEDDTLTFLWQDALRESAATGFTVARAAYDEIAGNLAPWEALRARLAGAAFVDIARVGGD